MKIIVTSKDLGTAQHGTNNVNTCNWIKWTIWSLLKHNELPRVLRNGTCKQFFIVFILQQPTVWSVNSFYISYWSNIHTQSILLIIFILFIWLHARHMESLSFVVFIYLLFISALPLYLIVSVRGTLSCSLSYSTHRYRAYLIIIFVDRELTNVALTKIRETGLIWICFLHITF